MKLRVRSSRFAVLAFLAVGNIRSFEASELHKRSSLVPCTDHHTKGRVAVCN